MWALLLGTGGGVLLGLGEAVGKPDSVEPVYKVSSEVVLTEEALETDPKGIGTASGKGRNRNVLVSKEKGVERKQRANTTTKWQGQSIKMLPK